MRKILERASGDAPATTTVTLEHSDRQRSRALLHFDDGTTAAMLLERGTGLRDGDRLLTDDGEVVLVQAAREALSVVTARDPLALARAAYHLGNRHIAVQIQAARLAYLHDHVLDDMLRELGFHVTLSREAFEPESGAYGHGHAHVEPPRGPHAHGHAHDHAHVHPHADGDTDERHDHEH
jgi:urease accessory protein